MIKNQASRQIKHEKEILLSILMIEDTPSDAELIQRYLNKEGILFTSVVVDCKADFIRALQTSAPDVILSDHSLPQFNSMEALQIVKERGLDIPFILVTGSVSEEFAVACIKAGADDYILKDRLTRLPAAVQNTLSKKNTEREKDIVTILNQKLGLAYEEISSSIKYAKRIQRVILPDHQSLQRISTESFIVHKPKDIVSGDFYWCAEMGNKFVVAVVDCTGHGVPGAFMSIIGNSVLNEIVNNKKILKPSDILWHLNDSVRQTLKQEAEDATSKDGMDIVICCIDRKKRIIEFSGANRPLFYYSNKKVDIIKGDKQSIGGFQSTENFKFSNNTIELNPGDRIFMTTDGYADQFGGAKEKKMMTKNFIRLLTRIQAFEMKQQKEMLSGWFKKWKGNTPQTDDVLVVGIEF